MGFILANAVVFTGTGEPPLENASIAVEGSRISWVGPAAEAPVGPTSSTARGKTILPGLIDAHAHLVYGCRARPVLDRAGEAAGGRPRSTRRSTPRKLLRMGFTAIRDVGTRGNIAVVVRDAVAAGRLPGPRIKASKQIISVWGGLGDFHPTHIFRREQYAAALTEIVTGPWEARNAVRQQVKDGVDWVKVEASGTGFNPLCPAERDTISFEELRAVVEEAEDKGRPVACHAESRNVDHQGGQGGRADDRARDLPRRRGHRGGTRARCRDLPHARPLHRVRRAGSRVRDPGRDRRRTTAAPTSGTSRRSARRTRPA